MELLKEQKKEGRHEAGRLINLPQSRDRPSAQLDRHILTQHDPYVTR
jgi:hypothetical protein